MTLTTQDPPNFAITVVSGDMWGEHAKSQGLKVRWATRRQHRGAIVVMCVAAYTSTCLQCCPVDAVAAQGGARACFQCGEAGHFSRDCPQKRRWRPAPRGFRSSWGTSKTIPARRRSSDAPRRDSGSKPHEVSRRSSHGTSNARPAPELDVGGITVTLASKVKKQGKQKRHKNGKDNHKVRGSKVKKSIDKERNKLHKARKKKSKKRS